MSIQVFPQQCQQQFSYQHTNDKQHEFFATNTDSTLMNHHHHHHHHHRIVNNVTNYNEPDSRGFYPIHGACFSSNFPLTQFFILNGAFLNIKDREGNTPLIWSLRNITPSTLSIVDELLKAGANPNIQNNAGQTALHVAIATIFSQIEPLKEGDAIISKLLAFGANPNIQTLEGETSLHYAVIQFNTNSLQEDNPSFPRHDDNTVTENPSLSSPLNNLLENLVKNGASVHAIDHDGDTPLHYAVREGNFLAVQALLRLGAYPDSSNDDRETPLDLASCLGFYNITSVLSNSLRDLKNITRRKDDDYDDDDEEGEEEEEEEVDGNPFKGTEFASAKLYSSELSRGFVGLSLDKSNNNWNTIPVVNNAQLFAH